MTREMVTVKHDGIKGTARVPKTALKQMKGWEVVDEDETAAASSPAGADAPAGDDPAGDASTQSAADQADTPSRSRKGATQQKEQ